jgi:hypothetical protein
MRQTLAIFVDAYRELNSRKLFWVVLGLSLAVVAALAVPGNNERGVTAFGMTMDVPFLSTKAVSPGGFYKFLFSWFGINLWLAWGATILALISTAGMIPELVSNGAVELVLSKPLGRMRLFLTKYAAGLMFVALQAAVFSIGAVLVIGLRGGVWDVKPLMTVPLMVLFYSYLFSVCALVGMLTRSTLLALLATVLVWLASWLAATVEQVMLDQRLRQEQQVARMEGQITTFKGTLEAIDTQLREMGVDPASEEAKAAATTTSDAGDAEGPERSRRQTRRNARNLLEAGRALLEQASSSNTPEGLVKNRAQVQRQVERMESEVGPLRETSNTTTKWHKRVYAVNALLPKTGETKRLFQRYVIDQSDMDGFLRLLMEETRDEDAGTVEKALDDRSLTWVIGTSLAFELIVLGVATVIFVRRDF